ncbi:MAG: hypothetical protein D6769_03090 [Methanobacteriota archaeon]|nr:MAG: hypothetical protein D6769_03090 [Euryarchaeota archaeon]
MPRKKRVAKKTKKKVEKKESAVGKGIVILTKTPYSKLSKEERNGKNLYIDVTGLQKFSSPNLMIFGKNKDPTSIVLLLEQILEGINVNFVKIESLEPFLLNISKLELKRFLSYLRDFLMMRNIELLIGGNYEEE